MDLAAVRLQGSCNPTATPVPEAPGHVEQRVHMPTVIRCECGWQCCAASRDEAVVEIEQHVADEHPDLPAPPIPSDLLAMAEELRSPVQGRPTGHACSEGGER
jgi:hypothetical protein